MDKTVKAKTGLSLYQPYERVRINVSGVLFETRLKTLERFPNTLLGDPDRRKHFYNQARDQYVFDTDPYCFDAILYYYQSKGTLLRPACVSMRLFAQEIRHFELGDNAVDQFYLSEGFSKKGIHIEPDNEFQKKVWLLVEKPGSSFGAKIFASFSLLVTLVSTAAFCLETLPQHKHYLLLNTTTTGGREYTILENVIPRFDDPFCAIETFCIIWFTIEILIRFWASPDTAFEFFTRFANVIDVLSIIPFLLDVAVMALASGNVEELMKGKILATLKVFRLFRVVIIFKTSGHSQIVKTVVTSVKASASDLLMSMFVLALCVVVFACLMYHAEGKEDDSHFHSIPGSFWWAINTLTTVGYGDNVPMVARGKLIASICAVTGAFTAAFFVPALAANFRFVMTRVRQDFEDDDRQSL